MAWADILYLYLYLYLCLHLYLYLNLSLRFDDISMRKAEDGLG